MPEVTDTFELMNQFSITQTTAFKADEHFESFSDEGVEEWGRGMLTRDEAKELEASMPELSLWSVVKIQLLAGFAVVVLASLFGLWSGVCATAGVLSVFLPTILFVWRTSFTKSNSYSPNVSLVRFYFWEFVKVIGIIAMLAAAVLWIKPLVWQALLAGFVVTVKSYGIGCWLLLRKNKQVNG